MVQHTVSFNDEQKALYEELRSYGMTSKTFSDFIKGAFHDAVDKLNISKLTFETVRGSKSNN